MAYMKLLSLVLCCSLVKCQYGYFPQRDERRISPFGFYQNFLPDPNRIRNTISGILHFQPGNRGNVVNNRPFDQYQNSGRNDQYENTPNTVRFPNQDRYGNNYDQNRPYNGENVPVEGPVFVENSGGLIAGSVDAPSYVGREDTTSAPIFGNRNGESFDQNVPNAGNQPVTENSGGLISGTVNEGGQNIPVFANPNPPQNDNVNFGTPNGNIPSAETGVYENTGLISGTADTASFGGQDAPVFGNPSAENSDVNFGTPNSENRPSEGTGLNENSGLITGTVEAPKYEGRRDGLVFDSEIENKNGGEDIAIFDETCQTYDGGAGSCIVLNNCQLLRSLVVKAQTDSRMRMVLQKSHCGFEGNVPKVCCPHQGIPTAIPTAPPTTTTTTTTTTTARNEPMSKSVDANDYVTAFPEPPVCGVSSGQFGKVVGGVDANLGDFPWIALLGYLNRLDSSTRWRCGGSLITDHHVLTAAHCVHNHEDELYVVRLGELDLVRDDDGASPIDVLIKRQVQHEDYNSASYENDIAVLVLEKTVEFTKLISPICLPYTGDLRTKTFEKYNPMIAGWGDVQFRGPSANHLQVVQLPVQKNDLCVKAYARYTKQKIDQRVLCAGFKEGGKDACQGDSGGPLMLPNWNNVTFKVFFYQIGVVSYGKNCAEAGYPGIYSRVTHFMPWLEKVVLGI